MGATSPDATSSSLMMMLPDSMPAWIGWCQRNKQASTRVTRAGTLAKRFILLASSGKDWMSHALMIASLKNCGRVNRAEGAHRPVTQLVRSVRWASANTRIEFESNRVNSVNLRPLWVQLGSSAVAPQVETRKYAARQS